jgi:hypothetical protein
MNSALTTDHIAEAVLIDASRLQREAIAWHEAFRAHEAARQRRWDALVAKDLRRAAVRNVGSAIRYARAGMSAHLVNERLRRARHDWRLAKEYEQRARS